MARMTGEEAIVGEFNSLDYQALLTAMRDALAKKDEAALKAIMSNHVNVFLGALELAADQSPF